jgi:hypothetical protein
MFQAAVAALDVGLGLATKRVGVAPAVTGSIEVDDCGGTPVAEVVAGELEEIDPEAVVVAEDVPENPPEGDDDDDVLCWFKTDEIGLCVIWNCGLEFPESPKTAYYDSQHKIGRRNTAILTNNHVVAIRYIWHSDFSLGIRDKETLRQRAICRKHFKKCSSIFL